MAKSIEAQASIIPSESLRFQSTFATVSSMGVTPEKLITSAEYYLTVLKKKEDEFNKTLEQHMSEAVTSKENETKKFDADMLAKSEQIKQLTADINTLQQQKTAILNEVSSSRAQIEQVKNNFYATMKVFVDRINSDIGKIKSYLVK
jgi:predicted  nucleic acid-binding Zn-ribbon protein